jgi:hypothetical protein
MLLSRAGVAASTLLAAVAAVGACHSFGDAGATTDAGPPGTATTDAGPPGTAVVDGSPANAPLCPSGPAPTVFCTTFEGDSVSPFVLECPSPNACGFVNDATRASRVLSLKTLQAAGKAELRAPLGGQAKSARCTLDYRFVAAGGDESSLILFRSPAGDEIANVLIAASGALALKSGANQTPLALPPAGWNHLSVTLGPSPEMSVALNGAAGKSLAVTPASLIGIEIGFIYESAGWEILLADVRCDVE